ncbi:MAG TPA: tetratricopeptide repeat protein, partial [bacterium]|nr:tetratricopeptide repeat protein [bacterium]
MQSAQNALQDNDMSRAIEDYLLAIKLDPQNWQAYQNLGGCYVQLRRFTDAKAAYRQSLAINPNNP